MANISGYINKIRTAMFGRDVRGSLADGLDAVNKETESATELSKNTESRQTILETKYNEQIANATDITEIKDAHVSGYTGKMFQTIGLRADDVDKQLADEAKKRGDMEKFRYDDPDLITKMKNEFTDRGLNIFWYITDIPDKTLPQEEWDWAPPLNKAILNAQVTGKVIEVPSQSYPYLLGNEVTAGTVDNQDPVSIIGIASKGSYYGDKPVTFARKDGTQHTLMRALGRGLNLNGICFDGKGMGTLLYVERGFELRITDCRFYRSGIYGLYGVAMQNARLYDCHFDEGAKGLHIGHSSAHGVSNTVYVNGCHFERNTDRDVEVGSNVPDVNFAEFIYFNDLHIEATTNTGGTAKTTCLMHVGNSREVHIDNSFLYGGKGTLLEVNQATQLGLSYPYGLKITNTTFLGHLTAHKTDENTPATLIDLIRGDNFYLDGSCTLDTATSQLIRIRYSFGKNVTINPPQIPPLRTGLVTPTAVVILDERYGYVIDKYAMMQNYLRIGGETAFLFANELGSGATTELNFRALKNGKTHRWITSDGLSTVMAAYFDNNTPKWGVFGYTAEQQIITGDTLEERVQSMEFLLKKFGFAKW